MLWPTVSRLVYLGVKPHLGLKTRSSVTVRQLRVCSCGAPFLTGGLVCRLQLLLVLASAVILESVSCGTHSHILPRFETSPTSRTRSPHLYPPGTGWPSYTPRHWIPFSLPPTTRRATEEVFEPVTKYTVESLCCLGADLRENTLPSGTPIGYFAWCDVFHCCITVYCAIT
jgi:hypothetical protein